MNSPAPNQNIQNIPSSIAAPQPMTGAMMPAAAPRALHTFKFPDSIAQRFGVKEIGIAEITARDHANAMQRAKAANSQMGAASIAGFELALESLRMVDGKMVNTYDGTADAFWNGTSQIIREMVVAAYGKVNTPEGDDVDAFLKSRGLKTV